MKPKNHSERAARATAAMRVGRAASSAGMDTSRPASGAAQPKTAKAQARRKKRARRPLDPDTK